MVPKVSASNDCDVVGTKNWSIIAMELEKCIREISSYIKYHSKREGKKIGQCSAAAARLFTLWTTFGVSVFQFITYLAEFIQFITYLAEIIFACLNLFVYKILVNSVHQFWQQMPLNRKSYFMNSGIWQSNFGNRYRAIFIKRFKKILTLKKVMNTRCPQFLTASNLFRIRLRI